MEQTETLRYEEKYLLPLARLAALGRRLEGIMPRDGHSGGEYLIRSLYFDSPTERDLGDVLGGISQRRKYRIRCYNLSPEPLKLECKRKRNGLTQKLGETVGPDALACLAAGRPTEGGELCRSLSALMLGGGYSPSVVVEQRRTAYIYPAGRVRVTLDRDIRAIDPRFSLFDPCAAGTPALEAGLGLLEVKYCGFLPDHLRHALALDATRSSFSKYAVCRLSPGFGWRLGMRGGLL